MLYFKTNGRNCLIKNCLAINQHSLQSWVLESWSKLKVIILNCLWWSCTPVMICPYIDYTTRIMWKGFLEHTVRAVDQPTHRLMCTSAYVAWTKQSAMTPGSLLPPPPAMSVQVASDDVSSSQTNHHRPRPAARVIIEFSSCPAAACSNT